MANGRNFPNSLNPSANPLGIALTQPVAPVAGAPQQVDPNAIQKFLARLREDPNLQQSLLTTGLTLLGDPLPGESGFGTFSRAALEGVNTLDQLRTRERAEGRRDRQIDIQEGSLGEQTRRTDIAVDRNVLSREQFEERMTLARDQLAENRRQFDTTIAAGGGGRGSPITGTERLTAAGIEALVTAQPELYPDNEEGRAKARIVVQGIGDAGTDPQRRAQITATILGDLMEQNVFLDEANQMDQRELVERAVSIYDMLEGGVAPTQQQADPLEGQTITARAGNQAVQATVRALGDGRYRLVVNGQMSDQTFTREQIEALQNGNQ